MINFDTLFPMDTEDISDRILLALLEIMDRTPYEKISVRQICDKASISRSTFYKKFNDKFACIEYLQECLAVRIHNFPMPQTSIDYTPILRVLCFWYHYRELANILIKNHLLEQMAVINEFVTSYLDRNNRNIFNNCFYLEFVGAGIARVIQIWAIHGFKETPEEIVAILSLCDRHLHQ